MNRTPLRWLGPRAPCWGVGLRVHFAPAPPTTRLRAGSHVEAAFFGAAILLHLALVWALPYLPTQDGPAHLETALLLKDLDAPNTHHAVTWAEM